MLLPGFQDEELQHTEGEDPALTAYKYARGVTEKMLEKHRRFRRRLAAVK
jgi:hypothetical protein